MLAKQSKVKDLKERVAELWFPQSILVQETCSLKLDLIEPAL